MEAPPEGGSAAASPPEALAEGSVLAGRFRILRVLGQGGFGKVWAAVDLADGADVALKILHAASGDAGSQLLKEARAAAALRHPNVVAVRELVELPDGSPVLVMERLIGETLADKLLRQGRLALPEFADVFALVVGAVGAAHAAGIVHRDLTPANIFLCAPAGGASEVKVLDFGIAKMVAVDAEAAKTAGATTTGIVVGTPAYMSPEQVFGEKDTDHRADIWALGLVAYRCLSGVLPTAGEGMGQILKNVLARPIPPLAEAAPAVAPELCALIDRMLTRDRSRRPQDLFEVLSVVREFTTADVPTFGPPARRSAMGASPVADALSVEWAATPAEARSLVSPLAGKRRRSIVAAFGVVVALAVTAGVWRVRARPHADEAPPAPFPLAAPESSLACPILRVTGADEPAGWLGAAAASIACERARPLLGGLPSRTRIPAELLDLPRMPVDGFPRDPYASADARDKTLASARAKASAYLDGEVDKRPVGFHVALTLRAPDGSSLGQAEGDGAALYQAVRAAMSGLVRPSLIPEAPVLDATVAEWSRARSVEAALALLDVELAMSNNAGGLAEECARLDAHAADVGELGPAERWRCAYTLGKVPPALAPPVADASMSPAAFAVSARIRLMLNQSDHLPELAKTAHALLEKEPSAWGRSLLASTESCLLQSTDPERARELSLLAVQAEPKNPDGQLCGPWEQLLSASRDTSSALASMRGMQAWAPWDSNAWSTEASSSKDVATALAWGARAFTLSPFDTNAADTLAGLLLAAGRREEARAIALGLPSGGYPVHRVESELLLARIEASEARFGAAIARAERASLIADDDGGYVRVQRVEIAWRALEAAVLLGRGAAVADLMVERFVDPEPPPLDWIFTSVPLRIVGICALASKPVSRRCFTRLRALFAGGQFQSSIPGTEAFVRGAERYAEGSFVAAAKAWRPLLRSSDVLAAIIPDAMATTFEQTGELELEERIDMTELPRNGELGGANLAVVRSARRAAKRGDRDAARALAKQVVDAWSVADETVPAVAEMRTLLARLR